MLEISALRHEKTWRLRKELTLCNKALRGAADFPHSMTKMVVEHIHRKMTVIRDELTSRKQSRNL